MAVSYSPNYSQRTGTDGLLHVRYIWHLRYLNGDNESVHPVGLLIGLELSWRLLIHTILRRALTIVFAWF